eukprot:scaffold270_cov207-Alexandrium_tamarense.AAC.7
MSLLVPIVSSHTFTSSNSNSNSNRRRQQLTMSISYNGGMVVASLALDDEEKFIVVHISREKRVTIP